jgi:hypothetical protein
MQTESGQHRVGLVYELERCSRRTLAAPDAVVVDRPTPSFQPL